MCTNLTCSNNQQTMEQKQRKQQQQLPQYIWSWQGKAKPRYRLEITIQLMKNSQIVKPPPIKMKFLNRQTLVFIHSFIHEWDEMISNDSLKEKWSTIWFAKESTTCDRLFIYISISLRTRRSSSSTCLLNLGDDQQNELIITLCVLVPTLDRRSLTCQQANKRKEMVITTMIFRGK